MEKKISTQASFWFMGLAMLFSLASPLTAEILWYGDPEKPLEESFRQLNTEAGEDGSAIVVNDPDYGKVWKVNKPKSSKRAELARTTPKSEVGGYTIREGDRVFVGWRVKVEVAGSNKPDCGFALFQLKSLGNAQQNHPVSLDYNVAKGVLAVQGIDQGSGSVDSRKFDFATHPMKEGAWMTVVLGLKFSREPKSKKIGFVEAWINGVKRNLIHQNEQQQSYFRTHDDDLMYFKWGAYSACIRSHDINVYMGDMRVGTTLASVMDPLQGKTNSALKHPRGEANQAKSFSRGFALEPGFFPSDMSLMDVRGKVIWSRKNVTANPIMEQEHRENGMFILKIKTESELHNFKWINSK